MSFPKSNRRLLRDFAIVLLAVIALAFVSSIPINKALAVPSEAEPVAVQQAAASSAAQVVVANADTIAVAVPGVTVVQHEPIDAIPEWLQILSLIISAAAAIAAMTPTPKDDSVLLIIRKIIDFCALNVGGAKNANTDKTTRNRS